MIAASIWEISIRSALGRLQANAAEVLPGIEPAGFDHLHIPGEHREVVNLPHLHKEPFGRLLVAQARVEKMILLTGDDTPAGYGNFVLVV